MGEALTLSYGQMGVIGTVNFCGYLGAVLFSGLLTARLGARLLISLALVLVAGSMVLVGFSNNYLVILVLYFLTGVGSALSNVPIMALLAVWFDTASRGRAAGLCVMGNGLGMLIAGISVPVLNGFSGGWRVSWVVLGGFAGCIAVACFALIRNCPVEDDSVIAQFDSDGETLESSSSQGSVEGTTILYHCGAIYFLFGFTYVIYVTFFVTTLVQERGLSEHAAGDLWAWVGILSLASGPVFGYLSDRYGRKAALVAVFFIQGAAYLLVALPYGMVPVYISLIFFGIVAWSVPTIMAALIGDYSGPERTAAMFGFITFLFGVGQIIGPLCGGYIAEQSGSFSSSFLLAALLALGAVVLSLLLPVRDGDKSRQGASN